MTTLNPVINEQGSSEPAQQLMQYFSWQEKLRDHDRLAIQVENTPAATKALLGFRELESPALDVGLRKQISTPRAARPTPKLHRERTPLRVPA